MNIELGEVQAAFAGIIWTNEPVGSGELVKICERELKWKKPTTYTVLRKLCEKGLFKNEDGVYTDAVDKTYFDEGIDTDGNGNLHEGIEEQLLFSITGKRNNKLEVYGILDIDDSEGATSVMEIRVYESDNNILNKAVEYVNGEVEYNSEQACYMSVIMDSYDDSCVDNIKSEIEEFITKQREDEDIMDYVARRNAEDDWKAEAADVLEDN